MSDNQIPQPLTEQERLEVEKLFADFAANDPIAPEPKEEPISESDTTEPKAKPTKKIILIFASILMGLLLLTLIILTLMPSPLQFVTPSTISAGNHLVAAVTNGGTVLSPSAASSLGGYMLTQQTTDVLNWKDIVSVSVGTVHTLGLKKDGTVVSTSFYPVDKLPAGALISGHPNDKGQLHVEDWTDIVAVAAGYGHSVGLRKDGTVVATGDNVYGQCNVDHWKDIIQIGAGQFHTVGLKKDGTVVSTKTKASSTNDLSLSYNADLGQCDVDTWTDIIYISVGSETTIGVRSDGTVVAAGNNSHGQCNVARWTNIVAVAAGINHTVGLRKDGTVVSTDIYQPMASSYLADYNQDEVTHWKDIVAIAVTNQQTFGLKRDGTVIYAGLNTSENNETKKWQNIRIP